MKENPIATRSKDALEQALLLLMQHMPYKSITIRMLTEEAGLSRQAFYSNFSDKDEVLTRRLLALLRETLHCIQERRVVTVEQLVRVYTEIVEQNAGFFRLLVDNELTGLVRRIYSRYLVELPPVLACQRENRTETERKYFNVFWVAAFIEVYATWLAEDMKTDREEIITIIRDIMQGDYFPPKSGL